MASKGKDDDRDDDRDDNHKRYAPKLPHRKYGYFRDDQLTFLVTHSDDLITQDQLKNFTTALNRQLEPLHGGIIEKTPETISFPQFTDEEMRQSKGLLSEEELSRFSKAFSIIQCELKGGPANPARLLRIVEKLNERPQPDFQDPGAEFTIEGTSLNWLVSVASQGSGTGGPGGSPSPYYGSRKNAPYRFDLVSMTKAQHDARDNYGDGEGVDVAILDTAPCAQDLVAAYKEWPDHPIIATLLGPEGRLHLYPATYAEDLRLGSTSLNDHDYKMSDHGLFIAGIVHSIAPKAKIHLIEVLNQYGVGDLTSFVQGLLKLYTEKIYDPMRKLVINCSWMLEEPLDDLHCRHTDQIDDPDAEFEQAVRDFSKTDEATPLMLEYLFHRFYGFGRQVFAAAGNDGRVEYGGRTLPRYPAALKKVTGVGALPRKLPKGGNKKYKPSVFSNLADFPEIRGITSFGGEEGEGKGVLGLYIGEFPGCCRNESKWAWWSGTSFASPILAGAVAAILSRPRNNATTTQEAIKLMYRVKLIIDGESDKKEDAFPVNQS